ncbi:MAG TPA: hypothetical protein VJP77_05750 [Planctomycetota bacterium]|nr:hypothetical protein [Planctomycetota bacterium]
MTDPDGIHGNDREEQANCPACNPRERTDTRALAKEINTAISENALSRVPREVLIEQVLHAALHPPVALATDPAARFVALTEYKRKLQASLNEANAQLEEAEAALIADLDARNLDSVKTKDGWTVYARRELSVKTRDGADVVGNLLVVGEAPLLTANWQRLKARIREWLTRQDLGTWELDDSKLPPAVAAAFEIGEFRRLGARKS